MSLSDLIHQIKVRVRTELREWKFARELAIALQHGKVTLVIRNGEITDVDVSIQDKPQVELS